MSEAGVNSFTNSYRRWRWQLAHGETCVVCAIVDFVACHVLDPILTNRVLVRSRLIYKKLRVTIVCHDINYWCQDWMRKRLTAAFIVKSNWTNQALSSFDSCAPRWTNSRQDKVSVLLICINGELHHQTNAHMVSQRRWTPLWKHVPLAKLRGAGLLQLQCVSKNVLSNLVNEVIAKMRQHVFWDTVYILMTIMPSPG